MVFHRVKSSNQNGSEAKAENEFKMLLDHDLRSAIADVLGGLQLLDLSQIGGENRTQITRIEASAELAIRLLDSGEHLSTETTSIESQTSTNISQILAEMKPRWVGHGAAQGLELQFKIEVDPETRVNCSSIDLERVLSNILENAAKFSSAGMVVLNVSQENNTLVFKVLDQGPGFSEAALSMLFTQGGRPADSPVPGSGLGLYIAHKIVLEMNGQITASNTDTGTLVKIELPISNMGHSSQKRNVVTKHLHGKRILVAEDNLTNQIVAGQMLQALGAEVVIADDGVAAMAMLQEQVFDLALLDIEMPRKSGLEVIQEIRALKTPLAQLPLVALTAYAMREHRQRILESGADGIIAKPLANIDSFGSTIRRYLHNKPSVGLEASCRKGQDIIDLEVYRALRNAVGEDVFADLLGKLLIDLEDVYQRLLNGFAKQDVDKISKASHVLIALAGAIGASTLLKSARVLNTACNGRRIEEIALQENCTLELLAELKVFLQSECSDTHGE